MEKASNTYQTAIAVLPACFPADKTLFVSIDSKEWEYMWTSLSEHEDNKDCKDPFACENYGEHWQYMGTSTYDEKLQHCFRHRMHPKFNDRRYVRINVSEGFNSYVDCV